MINVCFIAPIDYCAELSLIDKTFCENYFHFILKWFQQPNSFEESYKKMAKIQIMKLLRAPLEIREFAFKFVPEFQRDLKFFRLDWIKLKPYDTKKKKKRMDSVL